MGLNVWLDDVREAPDGWVHVFSVTEAREYLLAGDVDHMSLDHDLGDGLFCLTCDLHVYTRPYIDDLAAFDPEGTHADHEPTWRVYPTGYDLVKWMAENNVWPKHKPTVHSANPVGAANMRATIDRYGPYRDSL